MRLYDMEEMNFYIKECIDGNWSVRQLERQIESSYYRRLLATQQKDIKRLKKEVNEEDKNIEYKTNPLYHIKDPYVLEFLNLKEKKDTLEKEIEAKIIDNLRDFILELGKGFLFEARQKRFNLDDQNFFVDLVLYNRLLRCYVLIDLKIGKITHQDLGQMQMYVNYYDRYVKLDSENKTIGILLCEENSKAVVKLTLPEDSNIMATEYNLYLPDKELLERKLKEFRELAEDRLLEEKTIEDNNDSNV